MGGLLLITLHDKFSEKGDRQDEMHQHYVCVELQTINKFSAGAATTRPLSCYTPSLGPGRETAVVSFSHKYCYHGM